MTLIEIFKKLSDQRNLECIHHIQENFEYLILNNGFHIAELKFNKNCELRNVHIHTDSKPGVILSDIMLEHYMKHPVELVNYLKKIKKFKIGDKGYKNRSYYGEKLKSRTIKNEIGNR